MRATLKARAKSALLRAGFDVQRVGDSSTMEAGLQRAADRGDEVRTVIDVGASNGSWTELALRSFPNASYLLVEAQADPHESALRAFRARDPRIDYVIAAAGDSEGEVHFDVSDPFGGVARHEPLNGADIVLPMTTIDLEIERRGLKPPFLVKLDTHGFEIPILEGAAGALPQANLVIIESYNFDLQPGSLRFPDMCRYMEDRGFRCIDLVDVLHRPLDQALWQFDLFFAPGGRPEFKANSYR
jgi:FkbM family methyltransferase